MPRSQRSKEGYLLIDHRNAPGAESVGGTDPVPTGATFESATVTCSHCHQVVILNPGRTRERGYCSGCDHYICDMCEKVRAAGTPCRPLNALLDELQNQAAKAASVPPIVLTDAV